MAASRACFILPIDYNSSISGLYLVCIWQFIALIRLYRLTSLHFPSTPLSGIYQHLCERVDAMPTYQYACSACNHEFEQFQAFSDDSLTTCPECQGELRKIYTAVGVVFKGSGFYKTDSKSSSSGSSALPAPKDSSKDSGKDSPKASAKEVSATKPATESKSAPAVKAD